MHKKGLGIAKRLGKEGAKIAIVDLQPNPQAEKELKELGIDVLSVKANVTDHSQVKEAINTVVGVCININNMNNTYKRKSRIIKNK